MEGLGGLAGGRERVLLVAEWGVSGGGSARGLLSGLAEELLGEGSGPGPARAVTGPGPGRRFPPCGLVLVLLGGASLSLCGARGAERRRLRELLRDVRGRLQPSLPGAPPAVLGVAVLQPGKDPQEEPLPVLEALLREAFPERSGTLLRETLQAAAFLPGGPRGAQELREAAGRALRAALRIHAAGGAEAQKVQRLPAFLRCIPWSRRSQKRKGHLGKAANGSNDGIPITHISRRSSPIEHQRVLGAFRSTAVRRHDGPQGTDSLQDPEEGVALTSMAPNGEL